MLPPRAAEVLRLLADPLRLSIVRALAREQLCTCHLVDELGVRQTTISNQLRQLREAGVVEVEPAGRYTYYQLHPDLLDELAAWLGELAQDARAATAVKRPCR
jgi:ArsR family transcriptional regulator